MNSHKTAITRVRPSVPARYLAENDLLKGKMLDFGCGKGYDARHYSMTAYDPHFAPKWPTGKFDTIMCNYVLNTVREEESNTILGMLKKKLTGTGFAYITVRRDVEKEIVTKRGTYQRQVYLDLPVVKETNNYCIYMMQGRK